MVKKWLINPHVKGNSFNSRKITFPFDITDCKIKMQFKQSEVGKVFFDWDTQNGTFEKISATEIIMKGKVLNYSPYNYVSDLQVTFLDGTVITYFRASISIIQNVTQ